MKKLLLTVTAIVLLAATLVLAGCSVFGSTTNDLANSAGASDGSNNTYTNGTNGSSGTGSKQITTYTDATKEELEAYIEELKGEISDLKETLADYKEFTRKLIAVTGKIGAYSSVYDDCFLNLTCTEGNSSVQGSGFIITSDGYVLTNNHVVTYEVQVEDKDNVIGYYYDIWTGTRTPRYGTKTVSYVYSSVVGTFDAAVNDDTKYTLEVVYADPAYDLALCKLNVEGRVWETIPFYDGEVSRGDDILVLGNARGYGLSVTDGVVSATGKTFSDYPELTFIQTNAEINGGNSGGPAINIYGGLVGVVNSKFVSVIKNSYFSSEIEDVEGMGFAIELDKVKKFIGMAETAKGITVSYKTVSSATVATQQAA